MKIAVIYRELFLLLLTVAQCRNAPVNTQNKHFWYDKNYELLEYRMRSMQIESLPRVRNVILFIGDGMGLTTITASRTLKRQTTENPNAAMTFDDFPATAFMQTDIINSQIPESAASSTALFCGVKTNFESIGVDSTVLGKEACKNIDSHTPSIVAWAQAKGLKTGFVTTSRITHATPAALYAHSYRYTEDDTKVESSGCHDIAKQLMEGDVGRSLNVILGGGMRSFIAESAGGRRKDGKNLTDEWINEHPQGAFVTSLNELVEIEKDAEHLLGIFANSHMTYNADRNKEVEPSLAEMTLSAIDVLSRNNNRGYLLIVEGGKIDLAHHVNNAFRALDETLQLDEAVEVARRNVDLSNSLIIVTSDHASAMSYSGFATPKDLPILGMDKFISNIDKKSYQILTYSSGPGNVHYNQTSSVSDFKNAIHKATIPTTWSNHAADDVPIYAIGPMANLLFSGTFDQTYLAHAVAYAMCIFNYEHRCHRAKHLSSFMPPQVATGIDAIKQEKSRLLQSKLVNTVVEDGIASKVEIVNSKPYLEELAQTSDLVDNSEADENSSSTIHYLSFYVFVTMFSINFAIH